MDVIATKVLFGTSVDLYTKVNGIRRENHLAHSFALWT